MPEAKPRVFGLSPGVDFPAALVAGLLARFGHLPPEDLARVHLYVNTRRMQRRVSTLFGAAGPRLLPRIRLVTDLSRDVVMADVPPSVPPLRRRLELAELVGALLDSDPGLAPRSAVYDLADSLASLLDEMQGEGVGRDALDGIDLYDDSEHWRRRREFLDIVLRYLDAAGDEAPDSELRQRLAVERLATRWRDTPPGHPVIVAGSTGSRGTTALFMKAVAALPAGCLVMPGFDFEMSDEVWAALDDGLVAEDHPQFQFRVLMRALGLKAGEVRPWTDALVPSPERNRLVSLALRPAPVTHAWLTEGPALGGLAEATAGVSLIEASTQRLEALVIAVRLRRAVEDGVTAAVISPDRNLTRRVAASLDRWGIVPDDSAGEPLSLSPPGRFLRHVTTRFGARLTVEDLLVLLKHPITNTGGDRGAHLIWTRELELHLRRYGPPFPDREALLGWAEHIGEPARRAWAAWIADTLDGLEAISRQPLAALVATHLDVAERLAAGPGGVGSGTLWDRASGRKAKEVTEGLRREAEHGSVFSPVDYAALLNGLLASAEVRDPVQPHPDVMIWGTLEARVQGAGLVILAGLNDGVWPDLADADPWLNRQMRKRAGLLMPERRIGLSAHDFQQAIAAQEVVLTRSLRDADAETVPSRWLNRLINLMSGLDSGKVALGEMRKRGAALLSVAETLEPLPEVAAPEPRPSPRPPVAARPRSLPVTAIQKLIRDPYAIYAGRILGLRPLNPLRQKPDAPLRGTVLHDIFEEFIGSWADAPLDDLRDRLLEIADRHLTEGAPWPVARRLWRASLERVADRFLTEEVERQAVGSPVATEGKGALRMAEIDFTLTATADRIDRRHDGALVIYDYKTGHVPTEAEMQSFDKQLLLEALMAEAGAFPDVPPTRVDHVAYIGLGSQDGAQVVRLENTDKHRFDLAIVRAKLAELIRAYDDPGRGYTSRRAMVRLKLAGDFDHLARHGEWDESQPPVPADVP